MKGIKWKYFPRKLLKNTAWQRLSFSLFGMQYCGLFMNSSPSAAFYSCTGQRLAHYPPIVYSILMRIGWLVVLSFFLLLTSESYLRLLDHWCVKLLKKEKLGSLEEEQQKLKGAEAIKTTSEKPTWRIKSKISTTHSYTTFFSEILFKLLFRSCLEEKWSGSLIIPKKISESTFFSSNKWWFRKQHSVWKSALNSL